MKQRYGLLKRPWGVWYLKDKVTGKQTSLGTRSKSEAQKLLHAKNEAHAQPMLNRKMALTYLSATDPEAVSRDWAYVLDQKIKTVHGNTRKRWKGVKASKSFATILRLPLMETQAQHFLAVIQSGGVSANAFLRKLHNYALDMNWLSGPVLPKAQWPRIKYKDKRGITLEEHRRIIEREPNPERRAFYEICWHFGGGQTDMASLQAENIDWSRRLLSYYRCKTGELAQIHFGPDAEKVLRSRPASGSLFPYLIGVREADRATEFKQRCQGLGIEGVTLHSYRYAWAERAKRAGYPERYAQQALGHASKAVHRAYAANTSTQLPSLEDYESKAQAGAPALVANASPSTDRKETSNVLQVLFDSDITDGRSNPSSEPSAP